MWDDDLIAGHGVLLAVRDYGGSGPPLVLIHGGPGQNLATWDHFVPHVADSFRAVALDLRGNGASSDVEDYSPAALASDVRSVVEHYGLTRPIVVGHSWGGEVAVVYASLFADCCGVVAVDGWITDVGEAISPETWQWVEDDYSAEPFLRFVGTREQLHGALSIVRDLYGAVGADVARRQFVHDDDGIYRWRRSVRELVRVQRMVAEQGLGMNSSVYRSVACPVLLVGAERSEEERRVADPDRRLGQWGYSRSATEPLLGRFPNVRAVWLPCGHDIPTELPEALVQAIHDVALMSG